MGECPVRSFSRLEYNRGSTVPANGNGPNPLLQNHPLMALHPPLLYLGYVLFSVPFAYAIASLILGEGGDRWLVATRRYALVSWALLGVGIVRYTEPDRTAAMPPVMPPMTAAPDATAGAAAPRSVSPDVMRGMLQAARGSLSEGRYSEAIAAYQAVLKRDPKNVDAMTHLGFIVAIGGHADSALETFDKALAIDPDYAPALLYRGQVLYEAKKDVAGAVSSWERFVKVAPNAEDRERVKKLIAEAKAGSGPR